MQALARRAAAPVFALAMFSSAALIFVLQPLFARLATPLLGGSPAVWNTSMAFFQAALLAGYLYAHLLNKVKDLRVQATIHVIVLAAAWIVLPVQVSGLLGEPNPNQPMFWLLGVLTLSVGAPFAAAAATAPLLQAWYARSGRADAHDPYYLYAASNLGSFGGLLAYPALIEPMLGAQAQSLAWSTGYLVVVGLIVISAFAVIAADGPATGASTHTAAPPSWRERGYWLAAAAVPSALVIGVTLHIATDVASAPMFWVVPLALYLLTFVLAFMRGAAWLTPATLFIHPIALALLIVSYHSGGNWLASVCGILAGFFFSALVCHLALSRARPSADRLTEFYLYVSLGGVLGGAFAAFVAPVIFNNVYEYPLALAAACLFRPRAPSDMPRLADAALAGALWLAVLAVMLFFWEPISAVIAFGALGAAAAMVAAGAGGGEERPAQMGYILLGAAALHAILVIAIAINSSAVFVQGEDITTMAQPWAGLLIASSLLMLAFGVHATIQPRREPNDRLADFALGGAIPSFVLLLILAVSGGQIDAGFLTILGLLFCGIGVFMNRGRPIMLASIVLAAFAMIFLDDASGARIITQERTFFGVLRTREFQSENAPPFRILMHGTTIHGAQLVGPDVSRQPLTYYHPRTSLGESVLAGLSNRDNARLALIGLGTGSTACLMRPGDQLTIYEIDPAVVRLAARADGDFTYVHQCQPDARIELGDARLRIAQAPDNAYDVILVDAFSSDAIPAHLLTREAIAMYLQKIDEDGIVILHLSNRNLALVSEAARVARDLNAPSLFRISDRFEQPYVSYYGGLAASAMILARSPEVLARLPLPSQEWIVFEAPPGRGWTDDYINMPRALWEGVTGIEQCRIYPYLEECGGGAGDAAPNPSGEE